MSEHVTLYSGGGGSWKAAKVVQARAETAGERHRLLFTDTLYEDADTYRFLLQGACNVMGRAHRWVPPAESFPDYRVPAPVDLAAYRGAPAWRDFLAKLRLDAADRIPELVWLVEGRDPWEVYRDERYLGNTRKDPCSKLLKRRMLDRWRRTNCSPADVFHVGIGEHEPHRFDDGQGGGIRPRMAAMGWTYDAPLVEPTPFNVESPLRMMEREGLAPARGYALGYVHDNCGGMCCKAGHAHWRVRHERQPERFAYDAMMEAAMRDLVGGRATFLRDRRGGRTTPMTLFRFRERLATEPNLGRTYEAGESGCGCMMEGGE